MRTEALQVARPEACPRIRWRDRHGRCALAPLRDRGECIFIVLGASPGPPLSQGSRAITRRRAKGGLSLHNIGGPPVDLSAWHTVVQCLILVTWRHLLSRVLIDSVVKCADQRFRPASTPRRRSQPPDGRARNQRRGLDNGRNQHRQRRLLHHRHQHRAARAEIGVGVPIRTLHGLEGRVSNGQGVGLGLSIVTSVVNVRHGHPYVRHSPLEEWQSRFDSRTTALASPWVTPSPRRR